MELIISNQALKLFMEYSLNNCEITKLEVQSKKLIYLRPEVAGGIGDHSRIVYEAGRIKEITHLHYLFDGWLGDDILATTNHYIVTDRLAEALSASNLTGFRLEDVEVSKSEVFEQIYPNRKLPNFKRLIPEGEVKIVDQTVIEWSGHDICLKDKRVRLIITQRTLELLKNYNLNECDIEELHVKSSQRLM